MSQRKLTTLAAVAALVTIGTVADASDVSTPIQALCAGSGTINSQVLLQQGACCIDLSGCSVILDPIRGPQMGREGTRAEETESAEPAAVRAAAIYDGKLILAGEFDPVTGTRSRNIVAWDGVRYISIGHFGTNDAILDVAIYGGELIVAGEFTQAGNDVIEHVAAWNGQYFSALGDGLDRAAAGLEVDQGRLYVAGDVQMGARYGANNLVSWDGKHFQVASMDKLARIMDGRGWSSSIKLTATMEGSADDLSCAR